MCHANGVDPARDWLAGRRVTGGRVIWREDVKRWHPGQRWLWQPGGMGVSDPGINVTSILTHILHGAALDSEYARIYDRFAAPIAARRSDVDLSPMTLVADAFMLAGRARTDPFHDDEQSP